MSLSFKYWVEFDEDGGIKALHRSKYKCENECAEYVVKLIPIERNEVVEKLDKIAKDVEVKANKVKGRMKRFETELDKTMKAVKKFKLN